MWADLKKEFMDNSPLQFWGISGDQVFQVWLEVKPILEKAIRDKDFESIDQIYDYLHKGEWQLWIGDDSQDIVRVVAVSEIVQNIKSGKSKIMLHYCACSDEYEGHMGEWVQQLDNILCRFGKSNGAVRSVIIGREGFLKALKGYKKLYTFMSKEL